MINNIELYEFDPKIYPYKLWIRIGVDFENIKENFLDGEGEEIDGLESDTNKFQAFTMKVMAKDFNSYGVLICFRKKKDLSNYEIVAHECSHATKFLCEHTGIDLNEHEPSEYVIGWMAKCCQKILRNKLA